MTNYEKYKEQIDWQARAGASLAVRKSDNTPAACQEITCDECRFQKNRICELPAIEWLKAECVEPEIEIGDEVVIIYNERCYTTYVNWVLSNVSNTFDRWRYDLANLPSNGDIGVVLKKGLHCSYNKMLYYIKLGTGRCYLISEDGIKLHKKRRNE